MKSEKMEKNVVGKETKKEVKKSSRKKVTSVSVVEATEMGSHDASVDTSDAATATTTSTEETWFAPSHPDGWVADQSADSMPTGEKLELRKQRRNKKIKTDAEKAAATNAARERRKAKAAQAAAAAEEQLQGFKKDGSSIAQIVEGDNIWDDLAKDSSHEIAAEIPEHVLAGDMIEDFGWMPEQDNGLAIGFTESAKAEPVEQADPAKQLESVEITFNPTGSIASFMMLKEWSEMLYSNEKVEMKEEREVGKARARELLTTIKAFIKPYSKIREKSKKGLPVVTSYSGYNPSITKIIERLDEMEMEQSAARFFSNQYCKKNNIQDLKDLFLSAPIPDGNLRLDGFLEALYQVLNAYGKQEKGDITYLFTATENKDMKIKMLYCLGAVSKEASKLGKPLTPMPHSVKVTLNVENKRAEGFRFPTMNYYGNLVVEVLGKKINLGIKSNLGSPNPEYRAIVNRLTKILRYLLPEEEASEFGTLISLTFAGKHITPEFYVLTWQRIARNFKGESKKRLLGIFNEVAKKFFLPRNRQSFYSKLTLANDKLVKEIEVLSGGTSVQTFLEKRLKECNIQSFEGDDRSYISVTPAQLIKIALKLKAAGLSIEQSAELLQKLNIKQVKTKEEKKPVLESLSPKSGGASETAEKVEETQIELA